MTTLVKARNIGTFIAGFRKDGTLTFDPAEAATAIWDRDYSGQCSHDRHWNCAHGIGGHHDGGVTVEHTADDPVPSYTWRCGCACHTAPEPQRFESHTGKQKLAKPAPVVDLDTPVQLTLFGGAA